MNKIETHYKGLVMGETAKDGIIHEVKCKLDDSYSSVTVRDKDLALITDAVDKKLNHSTDLPAEDRFLNIDVDTAANDLAVTFRAAHNAWRDEHTFHAYITLRYEQ